MKASDAAAKPRSWAMKVALGLMVVGVAGFLYVLFAASSKPQAAGGYERFAEGALEKLVVMPEAPPQTAATLSDAAGADTTLAAFHGDVVLVNYWATWCGPCKEEMPTLGALQTRFEGRGFRVVPISVDTSGERAKAQAELARLSNGVLPFYISPSRAILFDARINAMPTSILYDRNGVELARLTANADWSSEEAAALIEAALAE